MTRPPADPESLARRVARAARRPAAARTLMLDLDGTLAPIAPTPELARVPPGVLSSLERLIAAGWSVAVVSGREAAQVRALVPVDGLIVFGSHGLEGSWPDADGAAIAVPPGPPAALIEQAERLADSLAGVRLERKPAGLAFHDRALDAGQLRRWHRRLDDWLARSDLAGLERMDGKRVVELRPGGAHKGRVVESLPRRASTPLPDDSLVAVGDDVTDEDMLRAIAGIGLGIRVGDHEQPSAADQRLGSPADVARFLEILAAG